MPPRLSKRQQRELEELEALAGPSTPTDIKLSESEGEDDAPMKQHVAGFAALFSANDEDEEEQDEEEQSKAKSRSGKSKKSKKKKKTAATQPPAATTPAEAAAEATLDDAPPTPSVPKSEKKAAKKAKAKAKKAGKDADGLDEIDRALEELSVKHPEFQKPITTTSSSVGSTSLSSSTSALSRLPAYLSVTLSYLDSDAEMRKFFGSKVVSATKNASGSGAGPAGAAGAGRRAQARLQANQRSNLVKPQQNWAPAQMRDGLSCRSLTEEELEDQRHAMGLDVGTDTFGVPGERWWTVEYSKRYKSTTLSFMKTVLSGDPQGFYDLLRRAPWHGDTLLQLAEVYRHREEHNQAIDLISRAIFSYERAFIGSSSASSTSFSPLTGLHRLAFPYIPNRPFFLAIHRQVSDFARRGLSRTAFEWGKLLWSLDWSGDPHGACFWLDVLGAKVAAGDKKGRNKDKEDDMDWLRDVWEMFEKRRVSLEKEKGKNDLRMDPSVLPGWTWSRALVLRMNGKDEEAATSALVEAVQAFPSVVPLLADKLEVEIPDSVRRHQDFKVEVDGSYLSTSDSIMHLLSHLYVHRAHSLWKDRASSWFSQTLTKHFASLSSSLPQNARRERFRLIFSKSTNLQYAVYRHVIVSESSTSSRKFFSFIPRNIQNESGAGLACDPLPPPAGICKSSYDSAFFAGIQDLDRFTGSGRSRTRRQREMDERRLARLIPDADFRHQLEAVFERNPMIAQRFPGGIVDFVQHLGEMGPEEMEDVLMAAVAGAMDAGLPQELQDNREMPGGFVDLVFRDIDEDDVVAANAGANGLDQGAEAGGREAREDWDEVEDNDGDGDGEGEEEDEEEEDIAPMPVRVLRNIIGRFWGGGTTNTGNTDSDSDEDVPPRDLDGVD